MRIHPLTLVCCSASIILAASASLTGCGGGNGKPEGSTVAERGQIGTDYMLACVDKNHNFQCDDGDIRKIVKASGDSGLTPSANEYVLIERRDHTNKRTNLLLSEKGHASATGLTTLKTMLGVEQTQLATQNAALEARFAEAVQAQPLAIGALASVSQAVLQQQTAAATVSAPTYGIASGQNLISWDASNSGNNSNDHNSNETRQLATFGSKVLSNTESNRLYLFDASAAVVSAAEIDLIPVITSLAHTTRQQLIEPLWFALEKVFRLVIDTASAASGITGQPSSNVPIRFEPGTGIAAIQLVANGNEAYILMNTAENNYSETHCLTTGNEGIYKVSLADSSSYRNLSQSPVCAHSGFSLLATDLSGAHVAAWESSSQRLWLMDGSLKLQKSINAGVSNLQALAVSPGGQFAALASYGQLAIVDLVQGRTVANLAGGWTNASHISFGAGMSKVVLTSGKDIHTVALDNALQLIGSSSTSLKTDALALSSSADGDSYIVTTAEKVYWFSSQTNLPLAEQRLPSKLSVKQVALAENQLLVLGQQLADDHYALFRFPLALPLWPK